MRKTRRKPIDPHIKRLRRLLGDDITTANMLAPLARAYAELNKPTHVAASTLAAAEYLVRENDPERLHTWLAKHTAEERAAIQKHLEAKQWRSPHSK